MRVLHPVLSLLLALVVAGWSVQMRCPDLAAPVAPPCHGQTDEDPEAPVQNADAPCAVGGLCPLCTALPVLALPQAVRAHVAPSFIPARMSAQALSSGEPPTPPPRLG